MKPVIKNSVITNKFLLQSGQINPVIMKKMAGPKLFVKTEFDDCSNPNKFQKQGTVRVFKGMQYIKFI